MKTSGVCSHVLPPPRHSALPKLMSNKSNKKVGKQAIFHRSYKYELIQKFTEFLNLFGKISLSLPPHPSPLLPQIPESQTGK